MATTTTLTSEQADLVHELASSVAGIAQQHSFLRSFLNPHTYVRYLRARQWDLPKATAMLRATLDWRARYRPHALSWDDVAAEAATGKLFVSPHRDREGRPVMIMRPRHENSRDRDSQLRLLVYVLEVVSRRADAALLSFGAAGAAAAAAAAASSSAGAAAQAAAAAAALQAAAVAPPPPPPTTALLATAAAGEAKMTLLIDFEGYSLSNAPPLRTALATLEILQGHYPERLGRAVCWRAPALFSMTWRAVSPLVDPVTKAKIAFVESSSDVAQHLHLEHVEECCGGSLSAPLFERERYAEAMVREEREAAEAERAAAEAAAAAPGCQISGSDVSTSTIGATAGV